MLGAPVLQAATGGVEEVQVTNVSKLNQVFDELTDRFPQLKQHLYDANGNLNNTYEVYIGGKIIDPADMSVAVKDGDEIGVTMYFCFPRGAGI